MTYRNIHIHNMGPFSDVELDLEAIEGQLIAISGPNGVGKTTLLELLTGGLSYRSCRTRGTLAHLATARDSYIEGTVVNGRPWKIRQTVDATSGKSEALVTAEDGSHPFDTGKVRDFDAWSKTTLVPPEVLYASAVSVQREQGFLSLTRGDRMAVLLRVIGMERLELLAEAARGEAREARRVLEAVRVRQDEALTSALDLDAQKGLLERVRAEAAAADLDLEQAEKRLRRAELAAADEAMAAELRSRHDASRKRVALHRGAFTDNAERLANNRKLLEQRDEIMEAMRKDTELLEFCETHMAESVAFERAAEKLEGEARELSGEHERVTRLRLGAIEGQKRATARLKDADTIANAVHGIEDLRKVVHDAEISSEGADMRLATLRGSLLGHKDERIVLLRQGLERSQGPEWMEEAIDAAAEALADDDALVVQHEGLPTRIENAKAQARELIDMIGQAKGALSLADGLVGRKGEIVAAQEDFERDGHTIMHADTALAKLNENASATEDKAATKRIAQKGQQDLAAKVQEERDQLQPLTRKLKNLEAAATRVEELEHQQIALNAACVEAEAERDQLPELPEFAAITKDLGPHRDAIEDQRRHAKNVHALVGTADGGVQRAIEDQQKLVKIEVERVGAERELAEWTRLAADVGRDGLQALEVDAAVPALNAIVNDMLHECHGSRFTVEFRTERDVDNGKSQREALDVQVIDNLKGRDALAETYSGGEMVIVGEAVALGLCVLGCECMGIDNPTLVRDETGAALDADNRPAYVRMLRHAAKRIGAEHVLYVSHDPGMIEAADARIMIDKNGIVTVDA
ncbi:MAG: ATP-binding cassette domain-containing protein [Myxococcales bacterium]|nr:ATP-binding cassette domain-containing protein [Myxococcales bacterium]